jgi:hypothetical protein
MPRNGYRNIKISNLVERNRINVYFSCCIICFLELSERKSFFCHKWEANRRWTDSVQNVLMGWCRQQQWWIWNKYEKADRATKWKEAAQKQKEKWKTERRTRRRRKKIVRERERRESKELNIRRRKERKQKARQAKSNVRFCNWTNEK